MNTNTILSADMLDILFDNRNKSYGAYELRRSYDNRVKKALLLTVAIVSMIMLGTVFANSFKTKLPAVDKSGGLIITPITLDPEKPAVIMPPKQPKPVQVRTEILTAPKIVDKEEIETPPSTTDDLKNAVIGLVKEDGIDANNIATPKDMDGYKNIIESPVHKDEEPVGIVQLEASYEGNWTRFLNKNLNAQVPSDNGAPDGNYRVLIQFVVDLDGTVSNIKPLTNMGYGMEQEAIRVIRRSMKWKPAFQYNRYVKAYRTQPITFQVLSE